MVKKSVLDSFRLDGKVALVTGGARGLGRTMATALAEAGADVAITARTLASCEDAVSAIASGTGRRCQGFAAEVTAIADVERLANEVEAAFGQVDILVNNAGTNIPQPVDAITDEDWDKVVELNLTSCMVLMRSLVPQMKSRKWGRVIHISSIMGLASKDGRNTYSATKAALIGFARASALDLGPYNITVNCIAPGPFLTDMPMSVLSDAEKQVFADRTALGRWGDPKELAGPALLLASDAGSYITGTTLVVDGGTLCNTF